MRLILVRHGQSLANLAQLVTGNTRDELSSHGESQAQQTALYLQRIGLIANHHFTSQWRRAQQTAALVSPQAEFVLDPRLGETDAGDVADLTLRQFLATWPDFYADNTQAYPGGESHVDLNHRVLSWLREVHQNCHGNVLAVTHAGPIACLLQHALQLPMQRFPALKAQNGSISIIDYANADDHGQVLAFSLLPDTLARQLVGTV